MAKQKKPIAAFIFDNHLKEENAKTNIAIFTQACKIVKDLGLSRLQHGGDMLHSRKAQTQSNFVILRHLYNIVRENGLIIDEIVGNHDKTEYSIPESFLELAQDHPAVNLIPITAQQDITKDITFHYLSYFSDEQYINYLTEREKTAKFNKKNVMITHIGVNEAVMNNGIRVKSRITADMFSKYDLTLIGHYHDPQELDNGRIVYCGASCQHNFGELEGKGVTVLYDDLTREVIELDIPKYLKFEVDPTQLSDTDIEEIRKEVEASNDNYRITLVGDKSNVGSFDKQLLVAAGVDVKTKVDTPTIEEIEAQVEPFNSETLNSEFEEFCTKNNLDYAEGYKYLEKVIAA